MIRECFPCLSTSSCFLIPFVAGDFLRGWVLHLLLLIALLLASSKVLPLVFLSCADGQLGLGNAAPAADPGVSLHMAQAFCY